MPDIEIFADIDEACRSQLAAISALPPFEASKIRLMPDAHSGVNSIVGFTATIQDKIIPNIVGGDIGCGVLAIQIKKPKKGLDFNKLDKAIRSAIPNGTGQVRKSVFREFDFDHLECWETVPCNVVQLRTSRTVLQGTAVGISLVETHKTRDQQHHCSPRG